MPVTVRKIGRSVPNELLPVAITDPAELAVRDIPSLSLWMRQRRATYQGLVEARPFAWRDYTALKPMAPTGTGLAPRPLRDAREFLAFGQGGALTPTDNGALESPAGLSLRNGTSVTLMAAVRVPANGGGAVIGAKLAQSAVADQSANLRWWGLRIGYGSVPGRAVFQFNGDQRIAGAPTGSSAVDYRDGRWHLLTGIFNHAAGVPDNQTVELRVDGVRVALTTNTSVVRAFNPTTGTEEVRIGAAGAVGDAALSLHFVGDLGDALLFNEALPEATLAMVEGAIMAKYPPLSA